MKSKTTKKWYYCRHCNNRFTSYAMAEICFDLDMKILKNTQNEKKNNIPIDGSK